MRSVFDPESPVLQFITKIVYSVWLNILWFVCCIPIFTIGPATTALFYTCQKMARDEEGYVTRAFFHSFRENFKQGVVIGLIMTVLGGFLCFDGFVLLRLYKTSPFWAVLSAVFIVACAAWLLTAMWVFPLLAHFDNTTSAMFKNAIMLGMRFLVCSALMAGVYLVMALLIIHVMTPLIIFGMGTCAFINSILLKNILIQLEMKSARQTAADGQADGAADAAEQDDGTAASNEQADGTADAAEQDDGTAASNEQAGGTADAAGQADGTADAAGQADGTAENNPEEKS